MTDSEKARHALPGHSMALCRGDILLTSDSRGIAPMIDYFAVGQDLSGFSVADVIVGKAAALLFVRAEIAAVYARTLSEGGKAILEAHGIPVEYDILTPAIRNRAGTGSCPMEEAVAGTDDPELAYRLIRERLNSLRAARSTS